MSTIRELMAQIDDWAGRKGWKANGVPPKAEHYALARIQWEECYQAAMRAEAVRELRNVLSVSVERANLNGEVNSEHVRTVASICLIGTELREATDAIQQHGLDSLTVDGKPEGLGSELADVIIRTLQLGADLGLDLQWEIERKMSYNETRPFKHGKKA